MTRRRSIWSSMPPDGTSVLWSRREAIRAGLVVGAGAFVGCRPRVMARAPFRNAGGALRIVPPAVLQPRTESAYRFLAREMDRWTQGTTVIDELDSPGAGFYPSLMGDVDDVTVDPGWAPGYEGLTCTHIVYRPRGPQRWAGVTWSYPDANWGRAAGRSLVGATRLRGWIKGAGSGAVVELKVGGVNWEPHHDPSLGHRDTLAPVTRRIAVGPTWQVFDIVLPEGADLSGVIGGLSIAFARSSNDAGAEVFLDGVTFDDARPDERRLIRSFTAGPAPDEDAIRGVAFLYDNALALLALLARGDVEGNRRARLLADGIVWAQEHDRRFRDGRWRNGYAAGPIGDPATGHARLPGWYDEAHGREVEDRYATGSDTGNAAWAILALLAAHGVLDRGEPSSPYLRASLRAGQWVVATCRAEDGPLGFMGGVEGFDDAPRPVGWRSTEHNVDLFAAFSQLALATGDGAWREHAARARAFVCRMWNADGGHFWTGTRDDGVGTLRVDGATVNTDGIPLDVQAWSVLSLGHDPEFRSTLGALAQDGALPEVYPRWLAKHCAVAPAGGCPGGYRFGDHGRGVFFEGGAHVAAMYHYLGRPDAYAATIAALEAGSDEQLPHAPGTATGAIVAACPERMETGFYKVFVEGEPAAPWTYPRRAHVGATAFYCLAACGANPYWLGIDQNAART